MEQRLKTLLFDFDGVVVDTEPLYDAYWNEASTRYGLNIENFAAVIKGTTLPNIIKTHFSSYSEDFQNMVVEESRSFENSMSFPMIPGAYRFIEMVKNKGVSVGLVTSSEDPKLHRAFEILGLQNTFDTVVSANRITRGKPDPMCYQLAAKDLNVDPEDCIVFEDSFAGIKAATDAGMRVIGLSTTNPEEILKDKVYKVIPNFEKATWDNYQEWSK